MTQKAKDRAVSKGMVIKTERRLSVAYDAGFFDGYLSGADDVHQLWSTIAINTKGIGPKLHAALMENMKVELKRRRDARNVKHDDDLAKLVEDYTGVKSYTCKVKGCGGVVQEYDGVYMCGMCFEISTNLEVDNK